MKRAFANSYMPVTLSRSPEEFQAFVEAEAARWARVVAEHKVRME